MKRIRPRIQDNPTDPRHGTNNGYMNLACRCDACRHAHTLWARDERAANAAARKARRSRQRHASGPVSLTAEQRAAQFAVCERVPAAEVLDVLMALGLAPYDRMEMTA